MAHEGLQVVVGTALVDLGFRRNLLEKSPDALDHFDLTPEEKAIIASIQAETLHDFARELHRWIIDEDRWTDGDRWADGAPHFAGAYSRAIGERVAP
ncbi:MAG TPA: hypothetical protein GX702_06830 [Chloroflexi bacterium]|jgi:hypothetical protein|nr:hypothetical protein [Chloroflexota bacterium]